MTEGHWSRPRALPLVLKEWQILLKLRVSMRSLGRPLLKYWWTKRILRTSTRSKSLRMPRLEKMGLEGDLGALKVINLNTDFWRVKMRWQVVLSRRPQIWQAYEMDLFSPLVVIKWVWFTKINWIFSFVRLFPLLTNGHVMLDKGWLFYIFKKKKNTKQDKVTLDNKTDYINGQVLSFYGKHFI